MILFACIFVGAFLLTISVINLSRYAHENVNRRREGEKAIFDKKILEIQNSMLKDSNDELKRQIDILTEELNDNERSIAFARIDGVPEDQLLRTQEDAMKFFTE